MNTLTAALLSVAVVSLPRAAGADEPITAHRSAPVVDVEIDPLAYAAAGYSLHVGLTWDRYRLDLGAFAADLPEVIHGNDGFDVSFDGFGTKLDRFWRANHTGPFAGIEAAVVDVAVVHRPTATVDADRRVQAGVRAGWRFALPADFYVTPWIGVGYAFGAGDRTIADRTFTESPIVVFPTVHVGRVFR